MIDNKFPESQRTFETRLLFIKEIFSDLHSQFDIMKKCVEHKLDRAYANYFEEVNRSFENLKTADPMKVLKKI